jgi:xanthine dehydrogenase YagS FAD-binding subunit
MNRFALARPTSVAEALRRYAGAPQRSVFKAGGIDLLDRLKEGLDQPDLVIGLERLPGAGVIEVGTARLRIGPAVTLAALAEHQEVRRNYPALARAAAEAASPQLRNRATVIGNLLQRPRCWYFRDRELVCLKKGGQQCFAIAGDHRYHAILGGGPSFIVHPSNCAVALLAYDGSVELQGPAGPRTVELSRFFVLPEADVLRENVLEPGELVTAVTVPPPAPGTLAAYLEVRERAQFDWPLAAVAVVLLREGRRVATARVVLGAAAPIPWRSRAAERALAGRPVTPISAAEAADAALAAADPLPGNAYKLPLFRALITRAILQAAGLWTEPAAPNQDQDDQDEEA